MGSKEGVLKVAAKRIGIPFDKYMEKINNGFKWCSKCKTWRFRTEFDKDSSRGDGLTAICINCRRVKIKKKRKTFNATKQEKQRAVDAIRYAIKRGRMVSPIDLPCFDCGNKAKEYHHHLGYKPVHFFDVVPLCNKCHVKRHWE